jgi:hypothetical protein
MIYLASQAGCTALPASLARTIRGNLPASHQFVRTLAAPAECDVIDMVGFADPRTPWPRAMKHTRRPTVVLLGDDPGAPAGLGGPEAWRCAASLSRWARAVLVHAAGGEPEHYAEATRAALCVGRVAMIETTAIHARAWAHRMNCRRTLLILPRDGLHPLPQNAEAVP